MMVLKLAQNSLLAVYPHKHYFFCKIQYLTEIYCNKEINFSLIKKKLWEARLYLQLFEKKFSTNSPAVTSP